MRLGLGMGLLPGQEGTRESLVSLSPHHVRRRLSASQEESSPDLDPAGPLTLDFQPLEL